MTDRLSADVREFIERQQELMFNERDFQIQLALSLRETGHYSRVYAEYYIPGSHARSSGYEWDSDLRLDIVAQCGPRFAVAELKYPTHRVTAGITRFGSLIPDTEIVRNHGAQDIVSYNFWKDVRRIEVVRKLFPESVCGGVAVMLTNEPYYIRGPRPGSICDAFSTADGLKGVHGAMRWSRLTATSRNHPPFELDGHYSVDWQPKEISGIKFYFSIIKV